MITTRIWADPWFENLKPEEKLIWLYILTNQQTNLIGIYEISAKRISNETGIDSNLLQTVLERFQNDSRIIWNGSYMVIKKFLTHQNLANPNMEKAASKIFDALPSEVRKLLKKAGIDDFQSLLKGFPNGLKTVANGLGEIEREMEIEIEREMETENLDASVSEAPSEKKEVVFFIPDQVPDQSTQSTEVEDEEKKKVAQKKKRTQLQMLEEVNWPHEDEGFKEAWIDWLRYKTLIKDAYKAPETMQQALNKFAEHPPEVGIRAIKDSISNQWKGVFPENKKYHDGADQRTIRKAAREPQPGKGFGTLQTGRNQGQ